MEAGSSSSAPPPVQQQCNYDYEVFLSFRGEDTRKTFTDHLYTDLVDKGIHTFRDDEELPKGEAIKPKLLNAINQSKVSVPILSKGYASSKWCLMELAQMVKCMEAGNQKILPIFYHVEPREVRHRKREYAEAFLEHQKEHPATIVEEWRTALETVAKLKGWHIEDDGYEGRLRSEVVLEVLKELKKYLHIDITDNVVGIDEHVDEIMDFLDIDKPDVRIGGIWGMAGSGKTTIAKFIYNQLMHKFDYCSFLGDLGEPSKSKGMELLQTQRVSDVLGYQNEKFIEERTGKYVIRQRFRKEKVLIVLDDVDQAEQLDALLQKICSVTAGSRIIITTRNRNVLEQAKPRKVDWIYEVKEMNEENALLLFCKHAFKQDFMLPEYAKLSREIVKAIGGVPLAIEVVASYLSSHLEDKDVWVEELGRLKCDPKIQETLRVGVDSLNRVEKEIFLDVACLFRGMDSRIPVSMWRARELYPVETINNLLAKSLMKITEGNKLWMHNLLRDLGRESVHAENCEEPGERSRLWRSEDGLQVLDAEEGTNKVKAICLARSAELEQKHFSAQTFEKLSRLLFLDLGYANLNGRGFDRCLRRLKWISWHGVGHTELRIPSELHLKDLVVLNLSESSTGENWGGWNLIQEAKKLEVLNLKSCQQLRSTPHFNASLSLKRLILEDCHELSVVHSSIGQLTALESLNLKNCSSLKRLPDELGSLAGLTELFIDETPIRRLPEGMQNLETLSAKSCKSLKMLSLDYFNSLKELNLSHTSVVEFCSSARRLKNLQVLDISYSMARCFPPFLEELQKLEVINASGCQSLGGEVPVELGKLTSLRILRLDHTGITSIPASIKELCHVEVLDLSSSKCERTLPELPSSLFSLRVTCRSSTTVVPNLSDLINLKELEFIQCPKLDELPKEIKRLRKLRRLKLHWTNIDAFLKEMVELHQLRELNISNCDKLESLPELPSGLRRLLVSRCSSLRRLPELSSLEKLKTFSLIECRNIVEIPNLGELKSLRTLRIRAPLVTIHGLEMLSSLVHLSLRECAIGKIEGIRHLCSLKRLTIKNCETLQEVEGLEGLVSLEELWIYHCPALKNFPNLSVMRNLKVLNLQILENLVEMEGLEELVSLETLVISRCNGVETIPNLSRLQQLKTLQLHGLKKLVEIKGLGELLSLEMLVVSLCDAIEMLPSLSLLQRSKTLKLRGLRKVLEIQGLSGLVSLESLAISHCREIVALPGLSMMKNLRELALHFCGKLSDIQGIAELVILESLVIFRCDQILTDIPELPNLELVLPMDADIIILNPFDGTRFCEHDIVDKVLTHPEYTSLELHSPEISAESLQRTVYEMVFLDELIISEGAVYPPDLELKVQTLSKFIGCKKSKISWLTEVGELEFLEKLKFTSCIGLEALPDLSRLQKLNILELSRCEKLKDIHGLSELTSLEELHIELCHALEALPDLYRLQKLKRMVLCSCSRLKNIQGLRESEWLERLKIENCNSLEALPNLSKLQKLKVLVLSNCSQLKDIQGLRELEWLEELNIEHFSALEAIPYLPRKLSTLVIFFCRKLKDIGVGKLDCLEKLKIEQCCALEALPNFCRQQRLKILVLRSCGQLKDIQGLSELECLEELNIQQCYSIEALPNLSRQQRLKSLVLRTCRQLKHIQGLSQLESLEELDIEQCNSLEALPKLSRRQRLKRLVLRSCGQLKDTQGIDELEGLKVLSIENCYRLEALPCLSRLQNLKILVLRYFGQPKDDIQGLCELECLEGLHLEKLYPLEILPNLSRSQRLKKLVLHSCFQLKDIRGLSELECLVELTIRHCNEVEALPNLARLQRLKKVQLRGCKQLKDIEGLLILKNLELDISECPYLKEVRSPQAFGT